MRHFLGTLTLCSLLLGGARAWAADSFSLVIQEDLLNRLGANFGSKTFYSSHKVRDPIWGHVLYTGKVKATLSNIRFDASSSGVRLAADVKGCLDAPHPFPDVCAPTFTAHAPVSVTASGARVTFAIGQLTIPIKIHVPIANKTLHVYTIKTKIPFSVTVPVRSAFVFSKKGQRVRATPMNLYVKYAAGFVRVAGDLVLR